MNRNLKVNRVIDELKRWPGGATMRQLSARTEIQYPTLAPIMAALVGVGVVECSARTGGAMPYVFRMAKEGKRRA